MINYICLIWLTGTQQGTENSRMYNEMVIIKMVQAMTKLVQTPPDVFRQQIVRHFGARGDAMYERIKGWMEASNDMNNRNVQTADTEDASSAAVALASRAPKFSLVPASRGFFLTLSGLLEVFRAKVDELKRSPVSEASDL